MRKFRFPLNLQLFSGGEDEDNTDNASDEEFVEDEGTDERADESGGDEGTDNDDPEEGTDDDASAQQTDDDRIAAARQQWEAEKQQELESKLTPYKRIVDMLGGDPTEIEKAIQQNQLLGRADQFARQYGWDDKQKQQYVQQEQAKIERQQLQDEIKELRLANEINDLRDKKEFPGIADMKKEIMQLISKSNGALNASQAYWALGGERRAQQMKRETEQRNSFNRRQRVTTKDAPSTASTEKVIPASVMADAKRMGMSEKDVRELMDFNVSNIDEYRQHKRRKA